MVWFSNFLMDIPFFCQKGTLAHKLASKTMCLCGQNQFLVVSHSLKTLFFFISILNRGKTGLTYWVWSIYSLFILDDSFSMKWSVPHWSDALASQSTFSWRTHNQPLHKSSEELQAITNSLILQMISHILNGYV